MIAISLRNSVLFSIGGVVLWSLAGCNDNTSGPATTTPVTAPTASSNLKEAPPDEAMAKKLLLASRKENSHPGIILRYSCQIPSGSSSFSGAQKEEQRAERLWDSQVAKELRLGQAKKIQNSLYSGGYRVDVSMKETPYPKLVMHAPFFDRTTAYMYDANGTARSMGDKLLPLGVRTIVYDGPDESSSTQWKAEDVHREEFGGVENLCDQVRSGQKRPDDINATVPNPK